MKPHQKGFTLIEMAISIGIYTLIATALMISVFQLLTNTERNNDRITAIRQVQNTGHWISNDVQVSQDVTTDNLTPPDFLILGWTDMGSGDLYRVVYTLEDMPEGETKKMLRNQSINGGANTTTLIARYINPDPTKTKSEFSDGVFSLTVTANVSTVRAESETRIYTLAPRPD